jgi:hypothetical protein
MRRLVHIVTIAAFAALLGGVAIQTVFHVVPETPLYGVSDAFPPLPRFGLSSYVHGSFQSGIETWINQRLGLRGAMVRTNNQIYYSLLRSVACNARSSILLGDDGWLYDVGYVENALRRRPVSVSEADSIALAYRGLQDRLAARHKAFLLVISPSKAELYPEHLPVLERQARQRARITPRTRLTQALAARHVNYLDGHALLAELKGRLEDPVMPRTGTHWSVNSSAFVAREALTLIQRQFGRPLNIPAPGPVKRAFPQYSDADLGALINVWSFRGADELLPYPQPADLATRGLPLSILMVGTSFSETLAIHLMDTRVCSDLEFLRYYRTIVAYPSGTKSALTPDAYDLPADVAKRDVVILEINEGMPDYFRGYGFVEDALARLPGEGKGSAEPAPPAGSSPATPTNPPPK